MNVLQTKPSMGAEFDDLMGSHFIHMFDVFNEGIFYLSPHDEAFFYNPRFYEQFGITSGKIQYNDWVSLIHPDDKSTFIKRVDNHRQVDGSKITTEYRVRKLDGNYAWIEGSAITKEKDGETFIVGCHRDISNHKMMQSYVQQIAFVDQNSGLPNRTKLLLDLDGIHQTNDSHYSLIYIQFEGVKAYVDQYGSDILKDLMSRFITVLDHKSDIFTGYYHITPDDFAIIVEGKTTEEEISQIGEFIIEQHRMSDVGQYHLHGKEISIGIYPNFDKDLTPEEVVRVAAQTCQFSRICNSGALKVFSGATQRNVEKHFYIEQHLHNAIIDDQVSVKFQPIVCARTEQISSFEALVRWRTVEFGEIYPDEFIPIAERKGLIVDLGYLVFEKACHFIRSYNNKHKQSIKVNVNVSVLQLLHKQFPSKVAEIAKQFDISPNQIVLELTETFMLDDNKSAPKQLEKLSDLGFKLSLDDFGAGYSSLNSFFDLPLDQIKIDKAMTWRTMSNPASCDYLEFVIQLCRSNNVDIVIEGIEDAQMHKFFVDMGASFLQGYWFAKPLSLASASHYTL